MSRHYNIPIFLPELACPFRCSYCNQAAISGQHHIPTVDDMQQVIERNLASFPEGEKQIEIAFFGGNFTGLPASYQKQCLDLAAIYMHSNKINGIRLSTRPDYINDEKLHLLKHYQPITIELGAQSLDDEVLEQCGRGHSAGDVFSASSLILETGFSLGLQMMIGLQGDNLEKALSTAQKIIAAGATETRIYPCLVIKGTELEQAYINGDYIPLSLDEAVLWTARLLLLFETSGVKVIRLGLHPSEELHGDGLVAGPYHPSFKELVMTEIWRQEFEKINEWPKGKELIVEVHPKQRNFAIGYGAANKKQLLKRYQKVHFVINSARIDRQFIFKTSQSCL